jgi:hypothetical protein
MREALNLVNQEYESSTGKTPEYLACHRKFKSQFTKFLKDFGCDKITFYKPNHFDISGFFCKNDQWWYFRVGDLRWSKDRMLIRKTSSASDYTGQRNQYIPLNDEKHFQDDFNKIVNINNSTSYNE